MKKFIFVNSHPIQYYTPLYAELSKQENVSVKVVYFSDESVKGSVDKEFGVQVKWDVPLLQGYNYFFLKNYSLRASIHNGFWGLFNPGIISFLFKEKKSFVIVLGWASFSCVLAIIFGKLAGHTICMRGDNPYNQELLKNKWKRRIKNGFLKVLFKWIDYFLYVGYQNKLSYSSLGVKDKRLVFAPHAVDNTYFNDRYHKINPENARQKLGFPLDVKIILFIGKYIEKKRPFDLLDAMLRLKDKNYMLVMVGEGELRSKMEEFIIKNSLSQKVILTGFINQSEIIYYYRSADVFVMCSGLGETWGLAVNEAMNFALPVVVSETTGCSYDLVKDGENGYRFNTGDIDTMAGKIDEILSDEQKRKSMSQQSLSCIKNYSNERIIQGLESLK